MMIVYTGVHKSFESLHERIPVGMGFLLAVHRAVTRSVLENTKPDLANQIVGKLFRISCHKITPVDIVYQK